MGDDIQPKQLFELRSSGECRWPIGEHRDLVGGFLFCARPTVLGAVYCQHHHDASIPPARGKGHG